MSSGHAFTQLIMHMSDVNVWLAATVAAQLIGTAPEAHPRMLSMQQFVKWHLRGWQRCKQGEGSPSTHYKNSSCAAAHSGLTSARRLANRACCD
jgi:hypothetical protein